LKSASAQHKTNKNIRTGRAWRTAVVETRT
jgi:hypothetical protein